MLVSTAFAQAAAPAAGAAGPDLQFFVMIALMFGVVYMFIIRPQRQQYKKHQEMIAGLRRGDRVVTGGGFFGTVVKIISDKEVSVEIAEGVRVRVLRSTISEVVTKTEPVAGKDAAAETPAGEDDKPADK